MSFSSLLTIVQSRFSGICIKLKRFIGMKVLVSLIFQWNYDGTMETRDEVGRDYQARILIHSKMDGRLDRAEWDGTQGAPWTVNGAAETSRRPADITSPKEESIDSSRLIGNTVIRWYKSEHTRMGQDIVLW